MVILPAIDIKDGNCVRLFKGDFSTVHKVAENPVQAALGFEKSGAEWIHMVDLDGAKDGKRKNSQIFIDVAKKCKANIELGGGIRDIETVAYYLENGISRVVLGSAAISNPELVKEAVEKYGDKIAVGIDASNGTVMTQGWLNSSGVDYIAMAKQMEQLGVKTIIFTDISRDGMLSGPSFEQLKLLKASVSCNIIASGGISSNQDLGELNEIGMYGAICGKAVYSGNIDLPAAIKSARIPPQSFIDKLFVKSELLPAIIQEEETNEVLMLAYMNRESLRKTYETGYTWFYSRSRQKLWNKGETSGHLQKVIDIYSDCDNDTLLIKVIQTGAACHTGNHSCFYTKIGL